MFIYDEFSSVVDRNVAKISANAISKSLRKYNRKMIAASCHYDIIDWVEPDWVYDLRDFTMTRRRLRRPKIELRIVQISRNAWRMFRQHHYLNDHLNRQSQCFGVVYDEQIVAFCAVLPKIGYAGCNRIHRLVTLPDYQGVGIGLTLLNAVASHYANKNRKMYITSSHPAIVRGLQNKKQWRLTQYYDKGTVCHSSINTPGRPGKILVTYEYQCDT